MFHVMDRNQICGVLGSSDKEDFVNRMRDALPGATLDLENTQEVSCFAIQV